MLEDHRVTRDWTWMEARWMIIRDGQLTEHTLTHRIYAASELLQMLGQAGFSEARAFGNMAMDPYDHKAQRLVVLARK